MNYRVSKTYIRICLFSYALFINVTLEIYSILSFYLHYVAGFEGVIIIDNYRGNYLDKYTVMIMFTFLTLIGITKYYQQYSAIHNYACVRDVSKRIKYQS